jgi:hypothetical protein
VSASRFEATLTHVAAAPPDARAHGLEGFPGLFGLAAEFNRLRSITPKTIPRVREMPARLPTARYRASTQCVAIGREGRVRPLPADSPSRPLAVRVFSGTKSPS